MGVTNLFLRKNEHLPAGSSSLRRILFILPNLDAGGAERVTLSLLNFLEEKKFELHLAVVDYRGKFIHQVSPKIRVHDLKAIRVRNIVVPLLGLVYRVRPQIIISSLGYLNLAVILLRPFLPRKTRVIVREASVLGEVLEEMPYSQWWARMYRWLYPKADRIICQSNYIIEYLANNFGVPSVKMTHIYNPVDIEMIRSAASQGENPFMAHGKGPHIVSAGRLSTEKGIDRLIWAFTRLSEKEPQARLWILGQGEKKEALEQIRDQLGLTDKIIFKGFQENPFTWFRHADLFVLSSRFEGLPNVLLEAVACGCPVVASCHPGGTAEVLKILGLDQRYVPALEAWKPSWWEKPEQEVIRKLICNFSILKIIRQYETLFSEL